MKSSFVILACFVIGVVITRLDLISIFNNADYTIYVLYVLMFFVGISIGSDKNIIPAIKKNGFRILILPITTIIGTLLGVSISSLFVDRSIFDCLAVGSGFGYYSLSSIFITEYKGVELGTIALVSNILRELITLLFAPFLVFAFGRLAPIASGGATSMDSTLPVISVVSGNEFVMLAVVHGIVVDFTVPFLVTFFCSF